MLATSPTQLSRSTRAESDFAALDFASVRSDRAIMKAIDNEELLFSELCTKTNHQGVRQRRLVILTSEALYVFKKPTTYQKRVELDLVEVLILSMESVSHLVIRLGQVKPHSQLKTALLSPFELASQQASVVSNNSLMLELTRRNAFTKTLRQAKPVKQVKICEVNHAVMERAFRDQNFSYQDMADTQRILSYSANNPAVSSSASTTAVSTDELTELGKIPNNTGGGAVASIRKRVSLVIFNSVIQDKKKQPPEVPTRKPKPDVRALIRRASLLSPDAAVDTVAYFPRCPPCQVALGVVQPIWSLLERALEPLLDSSSPPASGLVRCADILLKLVGEQGPKSELEAIKAVALLCFDKDAARALLRSLHENLPILGGSALVDSLDALQRCENVQVRGWAIKSLWKLLPMCMSEHALPITSDKWMAALNPEVNGMDNAYVANEGEAWFLKTYFRGKIQFGVHEKEPLRRIAKRKASFSVLGGNYRSSISFPTGLTPLLVQQAFSQVLLQNMFDVQRRAAFAEKTFKSHSREAMSEGGNSSIGGGGDELLQLVGVTEADCIVVLELLLNSLSNPLQDRKHLEITGKRITNTVILPTLMGMLVLLEQDTARQKLLKDVSLLLLRSETNLKAVLDIPDWQLLFVPLLQTIPKLEMERTNEQRTLYKYVLNLLTMIHTYCFKELTCRGGPLGHMLNTTCHSLGIFAGWNTDTIGVARWIYLGLATQLSNTARLWWHDPDAPEWTAFGQLVRSIEEFVFFHVVHSPSPAVEDGALKSIVKAELPLKTSMVSEDDYGSGEEDGGFGGLEETRALGKRKKRQFSITPVYELKEFIPVVLPLSPRDAKQLAGELEWIISASSLSVLDGGIPSSSLGGPTNKTKSVRSKIDPNNPLLSSSMGTKAYNAHDKFKHFGLHLDGEIALDLPLVECAVDLLKRMGITGNAPEDMRRADLLKQASKKHKSLLKSASEWCQTLQTISQLLSDLGSSTEEVALKNTMNRIAQFVETRYDGGGKTVKLGVKQTKAVATKLEASVLKQRQLAKQQLLAMNQERNAAVVVSATIVIQQATDGNSGGEEEIRANHRKQTAKAKQSQVVATTRKRTNSVVGRVRFYSSQPDSPPNQGEELPSPPPLPKLTAIHHHHGTMMDPKKQSIMTRHGISFDAGEEDCNGQDYYSPLPPPPPPPPTADVQVLYCEECSDRVDDFDSVKHSGFLFHSDCFLCEECKSPLLKSERPEENNLFFQSNGRLKKFCGLECRMALLTRQHSEDMCPGCMSYFQVGDHAIQSCGRLWHVEHLNCQDCDNNLGMNGSEYFPVEVEQGVKWPFCLTCHEKRFKTCAKCNQGILSTDLAFDVLGRVFHQNHFNCFGCGDNFTGKREFYVDGHGDHARALCFKCWNDSNSPRICCDLCNLVLGDSDDCVELGGKIYHASRCFICSNCKDPLHEGEVFENPETTAPLCDTCFYAKKGVRCTSCQELILENPLVTEEGNAYHVQCFGCGYCNGLVLTGKYFLESGRPICEQHWNAQHSTQCKQCQLPITNQQAKLTLNQTDYYHVPCLVCHHCQLPLGGEGGGEMALHVGPDDMYYCDEHAGGVCPHPGCRQPCWADGKLHRIAGQFLCQMHYTKASEKYMEDACTRCGLAIKEYEGLEILQQAFHYECFACTRCQIVFEDGEDFQTLPDSPLDAVHAHCL
ncbi:hypothetical protein BASA81_007340 [Batrachochytrium salamandrivorans]|nr:hypothetical protein BASA81_007340 [Batrachochytrium salamandrivorans]